MLKTEILRIATLMAEEPNEVSREIYLDQISELLGDTQAESLVLAGYLRQFKRSWDAAQPSRIDFDEWVEISANNLEASLTGLSEDLRFFLEQSIIIEHTTKRCVSYVKSMGMTFNRETY